MKVSILFLVISFAFGVNANGQEKIYGKILMKNFPSVKTPINFESVRDDTHLSISDVVRKSDSFLRKSFGEKVKPKIFGVCYRMLRVKGGKIWCWSIGYYHPEGGDFDNHRIFYVYLTPKGEPLVKVEDDRRDSDNDK